MLQLVLRKAKEGRARLWHHICGPINLLTYDAKDHAVITKIIGMWEWL